MTNVEKVSWTAGIIGAAATVFALVWSVWIYYRPPISAPTTVPDTTASTNTKVSLPTPGPSPAAPLPSYVEPESLIPKVTTGISRKFLETMFGSATFDQPDQHLGIRNLIFVFPRFFLQAVISSDEKVVFYSVTSRDVEFRPEVPKLGGRLIDTKFASFGNAGIIYGDMTSKYYEYAEKFSLGNSGNYRTIYLGYCPSGAPPDWDKFAPVVLDDHDVKVVARFRAQNAPNCYGVGDINGDEDALVLAVRIGLDYYMARDLP